MQEKWPDYIIQTYIRSKLAFTHSNLHNHGINRAYSRLHYKTITV